MCINSIRYRWRGVRARGRIFQHPFAPPATPNPTDTPSGYWYWKASLILTKELIHSDYSWHYFIFFVLGEESIRWWYHYPNINDINFNLTSKDGINFLKINKCSKYEFGGKVNPCQAGNNSELDINSTLNAAIECNLSTQSIKILLSRFLRIIFQLNFLFFHLHSLYNTSQVKQLQ